MKKRMINLLGIAAITLLLAGCGAKTDTATSSESSNAGVQPKEEVTASADTSVSEEGSEPEDTSQADASGSEEAQAAESQTGTEESKSAESQTGAAESKSADTQSGGAIISEDEAKSIALKDAGVKEKELSGIRIKLETDDGIQEYEVDFYADNKEYDYDIDAVTGEIRSKDMDVDDDFRWKASSSSSGATISEAKAKKIALKKVSGATENDIRLHLDNDDGRKVYEGSIIYNEREYDFEIDANSGDILEWEEESIYD